MFPKLMRHPLPALVWECWRLSRRWYLWVLPVIFGIDLFFMNRADRFIAGQPMQTLERGFVLLGPSVFMVNFTIALFTSLLALSVGSRSGFPLSFAYGLPVRNWLLVAVPMLTVTTLCASLYVVPMAVCSWLYGVEFPLFAPGALIATLVVILVASSWVATSTTARTFTMLFALFNSVQLVAVLDPFNMRANGGGLPPLADMVILAPAQYAFLLGVCLLLFYLTLAAIRRQRHGETPRQGYSGLAREQARKQPSRLATAIERTTDWLALPCPTTSSWHAELWLELKRQGIPVLLIGGVVALTVPLMFVIGITPGVISDRLDYAPLAIVFVAGIAIAVFNRRQTTGGFMSAFEGTRSMTTTALALLQMLALGTSLLCGMLLVSASVYFSAGMLDAPSAFAKQLQAVMDADGSALSMLSSAVMQLGIFLTAIALFICVHAWSAVWGRIVPYGFAIVACYGLIFAFRVQNRFALLEDIQQHMWGFAAVITALTVVAFGRTFYLKILSLRAGIVTLLCWAAFAACSLYSLAQQGIVIANQAPELRAMNAALLLLPATLFVLLLWSYDRLRHR